MSYFGVRRLIIIDSGQYNYAEVDLSRPVHLAAINSGGKTTLVNSLQFLYVDDLEKMLAFPRSIEDTRRHYFSSDYSYIIFECQTPAGIRCMLVRGLGEAGGCLFERYIYDGEFKRSDFTDEKDAAAPFEMIRRRLADRNLSAVSKRALWEVLSGTSTGDGAPSLNILPIQDRSDYESFRNVYVKLLSLANVRADALRQLIIDCHARELDQKPINVAIEYKREYERAHRHEQDTAFIRAVADPVQRGREIRHEIDGMMSRLARELPEAFAAHNRCQSWIELALVHTRGQMETMDSAIQERDARKSALTDKLIGAEVDARDARQRIERVDAQHRQFGALTTEMVEALEREADDVRDKMATLRRDIDRGERLSALALHREVDALAARLTTEETVLANWENTLLSHATRGGLPDSVLEAAFRVLNPELLQLQVGRDVRLRARHELDARVRAIAKKVQDGHYRDEAVEIDVSKVAGAAGLLIKDRQAAEATAEMHRHDLAERQRQLKVAEKLDVARAALAQMKVDHDRRTDYLDSYRSYAQEWSRRADLLALHSAAIASVKALKAQIAEVVHEIEQEGRDRQELNEQRDELQQRNRDLGKSLERLKAELQSFDLIAPPPDSAADTKPEDSAKPPSLNEVRSKCVEIDNTTERLCDAISSIKQMRERVSKIESEIRAITADYPTEPYHFNDADADWSELSTKLDALEEMEATARQEWDLLFSRVAARFDNMVKGLARVEKAVQKINREISTYRVSNLKRLEIKCERLSDKTALIEAVTGRDGIFTDRARAEDAKEQLRRMIDAGESVELGKLFAIRIRVQHSDGREQHAPSLDELGSTGTIMTAKTMIFIQLIRAIASDARYRLQFFVDETGSLDARNLHAITEMAVTHGVMPITAEPMVKAEPLAHPEVMICMLGQDSRGKFYIDAKRIIRARLLEKAVEVE